MRIGHWQARRKPACLHPPNLVAAAYANIAVLLATKAEFKECPGCGRIFQPKSGRQTCQSRNALPKHGSAGGKSEQPKSNQPRCKRLLLTAHTSSYVVKKGVSSHWSSAARFLLPTEVSKKRYSSILLRTIHRGFIAAC
jgi:hypothetical protein